MPRHLFEKNSLTSDLMAILCEIGVIPRKNIILMSGGKRNIQYIFNQKISSLSKRNILKIEKINSKDYLCVNNKIEKINNKYINQFNTEKNLKDKKEYKKLGKNNINAINRKDNMTYFPCLMYGAKISVFKKDKIDNPFTNEINSNYIAYYTYEEIKNASNIPQNTFSLASRSLGVLIKDNDFYTCYYFAKNLGKKTKEKRNRIKDLIPAVETKYNFNLMENIKFKTLEKNRGKSAIISTNNEWLLKWILKKKKTVLRTLHNTLYIFHYKDSKSFIIWSKFNKYKNLSALYGDLKSDNNKYIVTKKGVVPCDYVEDGKFVFEYFLSNSCNLVNLIKYAKLDGNKDKEFIIRCFEGQKIMVKSAICNISNIQLEIYDYDDVENAYENYTQNN